MGCGNTVCHALSTPSLKSMGSQKDLVLESGGCLLSVQNFLF